MMYFIRLIVVINLLLDEAAGDERIETLKFIYEFILPQVKLSYVHWPWSKQIPKRYTDMEYF